METILRPLVISTGIVIVIEILQLINQGSIGGLLYWFGERTFSISTPNIAKIDILGRVILRPYSIFSHPNSLAGFLFVILILINKSQKYLYLLPIIVFGIIMTFSKSVILCLILFILNIQTIYLIIFTIFNTLLPLIDFGNAIYQLPKYLSSRLYFATNAVKIICKFPIFGVGYGNYITSLDSVMSLREYSFQNFQPVHNCLLLFISECGLLNILFGMTIYYKKLKKIILSNNFRSIAIIILLATFDHYFYTLPQNKLILLISLLYLV